MARAPLDLANDMEYMAKLHPNHFWHLNMQEGAEVIRKLCVIIQRLKPSSTADSPTENG